MSLLSHYFYLDGMHMDYKNCWEIKGCGRTPDNIDNIKTICPVFDAKIYSGINHGRLGGRMCWFISGTLCNDQVQGNYSMKKDTCLLCDVYKQIQLELSQEYSLQHS